MQKKKKNDETRVFCTPCTVEKTEFYCHSFFFQIFRQSNVLLKNFTVNWFDEKKFAWRWISHFSILCCNFHSVLLIFTTSVSRFFLSATELVKVLNIILTAIRSNLNFYCFACMFCMKWFLCFQTSLKFWPWVQCINFRFIPQHSRITFIAFATYIWANMLSSINSKNNT